MDLPINIDLRRALSKDLFLNFLHFHRGNQVDSDVVAREVQVDFKLFI